MACRASVVAGTLATLWLAGCGGGGGEPPEPAAAVPVTVYTVAGDVARSDGKYSANVQPYSQVDLAFEVGGYIAAIAQVPGIDGQPRAIQGGDPVAAGDVLAGLQDDTYREEAEQAAAALDAAGAALRKASADFERSKRLHAKDFLSQSDFDAAREAYQAARAQVLQSEAALEQARTELSYCTLESPLDGVVVQRQIEVGTLVGVGTTAFQVADTSRMKVMFAVPGALVLRLAPGEALPVTVSALLGAELVGHISRIDPAADQKTRAFDVELTVANPTGRLKSGMVATVTVPEDARAASTFLVPLGAVVRPPDDPAGYAVLVLAEQDEKTVASLRPVELGEVFGNRIAVLRGLDAGDPVIVRGASIVRDGQQVRVIP